MAAMTREADFFPGPSALVFSTDPFKGDDYIPFTESSPIDPGFVIKTERGTSILGNSYKESPVLHAIESNTGHCQSTRFTRDNGRQVLIKQERDPSPSPIQDANTQLLNDLLQETNSLGERIRSLSDKIQAQSKAHEDAKRNADAAQTKVRKMESTSKNLRKEMTALQRQLKCVNRAKNKQHMRTTEAQRSKKRKTQDRQRDNPIDLEAVEEQVKEELGIYDDVNFLELEGP